ncbi:MAG: aminomethyl-transferring glycine dehydrogenase subunit GcvPA [Candidatus Obscuribacterales bacterium]|nr:aminomethyl-transferring glycine dehydrogenase subunit GcvPA [Candidatus Obscuribacterales bacterium]
MTEQNYSNIPYLPHTEGDRQEMLAALGKRTFEELISHIPQEVRAKTLELQDGLSEMELSQHVAELAAKNKSTSTQPSFLGGGSYHRYVPAIVGAVCSRSEFSTAYTPYQPEVAQGSLQVIYEFQTAICLLTGMDVANASMYDGPTACAEAALMATRLTNRKKIVVSETVNPEYSMVTHTYVNSCGLEWQTLSGTTGVTKLEASDLDQSVAAVIVQYPNYFGCLEKLSEYAEAVHKNGSLLIVITDPISLGLLTPPGLFGADIVIGDAQSCGNSLSFGGPSAGYMACRKEFIRQLPGRLAGATVDNRGQRAFTLTLQTREQHIRRARATSNICTNQALNALAMLVYLTYMGPQGLKQIANISLQRAHYLADKLAGIEGVSLAFNAPFFNEFVLTTSFSAIKVLAELEAQGVLGGIAVSAFKPELPNAILVATTELTTPSDIEKYLSAMATVMKSVKTGVETQKQKVPVA